MESVASHRPTRGAASGVVRTRRDDGRTVAAVANLGSAGVNSPCAAAIIMAAARSQPDRSSGRQQTSLRKCMLFILRLRSAIFAVVTSAEIIPSRQRGQFASSYIRIGEFVPELPRNPNRCVTPDPESQARCHKGLGSGGKGTFGRGHLGHKTAHLVVIPGAMFCGVLSTVAVLDTIVNSQLAPA